MTFFRSLGFLSILRISLLLMYLYYHTCRFLSSGKVNIFSIKFSCIFYFINIRGKIPITTSNGSAIYINPPSTRSISTSGRKNYLLHAKAPCELFRKGQLINYIIMCKLSIECTQVLTPSSAPVLSPVSPSQPLPQQDLYQVWCNKS